MRPWRIRVEGEQAVPLWLATGVLRGIGTGELARCFLDTVRQALAASHCTIFGLEPAGGARVISAASSYGDAAAATAQEYIRQGFDRQDSNMVWLARRKTPRSSQIWMSHQNADEVGNPGYRLVCYGEHGIRERVSVLLLLDSGARIAVSFYRGLAAEPFGPADLQWVQACAPLLLAAVTAHSRKEALPSGAATLREKIGIELPRREREVMTHVLDGLTTAQIAQRLRLSPTTVLTYRYRAYAKLGVRTHRELLSLTHAPP